jgi:hypothetical protein
MVSRHSAIELLLGDFQRLSGFGPYYFQQCIKQRGVPTFQIGLEIWN